MTTQKGKTAPTCPNSAAPSTAELETLIADEPLQERLRGQLMLALYRAGRQADALALYRKTSELLRDELGLEPSRALQELERLILQQHTALEPAPRATPPPHWRATSRCRRRRSSAALVSWPSSPRFCAPSPLSLPVDRIPVLERALGIWPRPSGDHPRTKRRPPRTAPAQSNCSTPTSKEPGPRPQIRDLGHTARHGLAPPRRRRGDRARVHAVAFLQ
ncbi:MAG: AfsR/SARP family transcriptional regulator [Solirubrobacteraceae bacterium]